MNWLKNKGEHLFYKKSGLDIPHKSIITSVFVTGCAMLIKKRVIRSIGLMDEDYFLYFEDVDICTRMWLFGWKVCCAGIAPLIHEHQRQSRHGILSKYSRIHLRSLRRYSKKFGVPLFRQPRIEEMQEKFTRWRNTRGGVSRSHMKGQPK